MSERQLKLKFNTAVTGMDSGSGAFDEKTHRMLILPFRAKVMQTDGITGMYISRYDMKVDFLDEIVDAESVLAAVQRAIVELMEREDNKLFPLRGDKAPTVDVDRPAPEPPSFIKTLVVSLPTDLTAYTKDNAYYGRITAYLGERLARADGVREYGVYLRVVRVAFDTRTTSKTAMLLHVRSVLLSLPKQVEGSWNGEGERPLDFFPFLNGRTLRVKHSVVNGVRVS